MNKSMVARAALMCLASIAAPCAMAQSSLTIYGNADISFDNVHKTAGVPLIASSPLVPSLVSGTQGASSTVTRVSPSATSQTALGFKGVEDLGAGLKASFVLEGQLNHDTGVLGQDGRIFGRQSYVGLTTTVGEFRLGRQYAPIFFSTALITGERFGATDLFTEGGATNNLQVRQDNQLSYWLKSGGFLGALAYTPNAGSTNLISNARGAAASSTLGSMLGAANAGAESATSKSGRAFGFFGNYDFDASLSVAFGFHRNEFDGARFGLLSGSTLLTSTYALQKYQAVNLGAKYVVPSNGLMLSAAAGQGRYDYLSSDEHLKIQFAAVGARVPVGHWTLSSQVSQVRFANFTKGKDTGVMLGAEYAFSKRTTVFSRLLHVRDDAGQAANAGLVGGTAMVQGGPDVVATAFGFRETPLFAGAGINAGGKSTYAGVGIRHTF